MKRQLGAKARSSAAAALLILAGCGGGSGSSPPDQPAAASAVLTGTAATGGALANAAVTITDRDGHAPCEEASITTTPLGSYTCTLKSGASAPFFIVVVDPTGNNAALASVATTTPAAGTPLTVNATPLTTAILAQLASDGNAMTLVASGRIDATKLQQLTANVVAQLQNVLAAIGHEGSYDPFTTRISAATAEGSGNTADHVLDVVKVVTDPATGKWALTTVDKPAPVAMATHESAGDALDRPADGIAELAKAAQAIAQSLKSCFALPTAQRVLAKDTAIADSQGGPTVTAAAPDCQQMVASSANAAGVDFLHNGYSVGQLLYGRLTSDKMTGARFSVPEITSFYPGDSTGSGHDQAVLNIKYIDGHGNPGNLITVASNIPRTASDPHPTWWLTGNQQPVDVSVKPEIRRVEQLNPNATYNLSAFLSGIEFVINAKGPGSLNADGKPMSNARVTGPGLPRDGLVYVVPSPTVPGQTYMDLSNKTGAVPSTERCGGGGLANCPIFWLAGTAGVTAATGADALRPNRQLLYWAQPEDQVDANRFTRGARYTVALFHDHASIPTYTIYKTLQTDVVPATRGVNLPWNTLGSQSKLAMDPSGSLSGAQSSLTLDWVQNPAAQQITSALVSIDANGTLSAPQAVPNGATSVVVNGTIPALASSRMLMFGYRMLDGSLKLSMFNYNN